MEIGFYQEYVCSPVPSLPVKTLAFFILITTPLPFLSFDTLPSIRHSSFLSQHSCDRPARGHFAIPLVHSPVIPTLSLYDKGRCRTLLTISGYGPLTVHWGAGPMWTSPLITGVLGCVAATAKIAEEWDRQG